MILCNPAMRQRHWEQMSEFSGLGMVPDTGSSLKKLLEKGLDPFMEEYEITICSNVTFLFLDANFKIFFT